MTSVNILIIEDKQEDGVLLEEILRNAGHKTWCCSKGEEGMRLLKTTPFAVVLAELYMPGMNGTEITKNALQIDPSLGVVVLTSTTFISSAVEAMEAGAYGYITKPFNEAEVKIVVRRAAERHHLLGTSKTKERFAEMSVTDSLTGAYNRRFLDIFLRRKTSSTQADPVEFSILMIDIDYFKKFNDTNGHRAGDELLQKIAEVFAKCVRENDVVFRYGGEEFLIYLEHTDKDTANLIAERILTSVSLYLPATVSIGIGSFPNDGSEPDSLIKKADAALYTAKHNGRNQICRAPEG